MELIDAIILGIVQGLTEFLPVSSSGHLVIFQKLLNVDDSIALTFDVAVHLATLFAVLSVYWKKVLEMIRRPFAKLPLQLVAATVPAIVMMFFFGDFIEGTYVNSLLLGPGFLFTGLAIVVAERIGNGNKGLNELKTTDSLMIGAAQGIALLPSVSRSGMTITTAMALGMEKNFAADFSFLLSIPPILGGALLDGLDVIKGETASLQSIGAASLLAGMMAAGLTGFLAIKLMLSMVKKMKLKYFAYYVFALGILIIIGQIFFRDSLGRLI